MAPIESSGGTSRLPSFWDCLLSNAADGSCFIREQQSFPEGMRPTRGVSRWRRRTGRSGLLHFQFVRLRMRPMSRASFECQGFLLPRECGGLALGCDGAVGRDALETHFLTRPASFESAILLLGDAIVASLRRSRDGALPGSVASCDVIAVSLSTCPSRVASALPTTASDSNKNSSTQFAKTVDETHVGGRRSQAKRFNAPDFKPFEDSARRPFLPPRHELACKGHRGSSRCAFDATRGRLAVCESTPVYRYDIERMTLSHLRSPHATDVFLKLFQARKGVETYAQACIVYRQHLCPTCEEVEVRMLAEERGKEAHETHAIVERVVAHRQDDGDAMDDICVTNGVIYQLWAQAMRNEAASIASLRRRGRASAGRRCISRVARASSRTSK